MAKVDLKNVKEALNEIALWTQAVDTELMAYQVHGSNVATLLAKVEEAVADAVAATAFAAATAKDVYDALSDPTSPKPTGLHTDQSLAKWEVKNRVDALLGVAPTPTLTTTGALVGKGC